MSRFEIVLYFSEKKQGTSGTTLDLSLLVRETKQLQGGRKASKLSVTLNVKVKYNSYSTGYAQVTVAHCQCKVKTEKDKIDFLLLRVQERNLSTITGFCLKQY